MRRSGILLLFILLHQVSESQTCKALFSYGAQFEQVNFVNHSTASNAHYFWNFGDGTGSNYVNPIHKFHENGKYLVVLYVYDTISKCSDYYEMWINVIKYSTDPCFPSIEDSVFYEHPYLIAKIIDHSTDCEQYEAIYGAPYGNIFNGHFPRIPNQAGNYIGAVAFFTPQTSSLKRNGFKTISYYNRAKHYNICSANFEFNILSEDSFSQTIRFTAMNKNAKSYLWRFVGFGDPVFKHTDTATMNFGATWQFGELNIMAWDIFLKVTDQNGCTDSLIQNILTIRKANTYVGIHKNQISELKMVTFPNPVQEKFSFVFPDGLLDIEKLSISNNIGQLVFELRNVNPEQEINISTLPAGIYYVKVQADQGQKVFKILKK